MRRRIALFLSLALLVVLTGLALTWIQSDHYIVLPDRARPTDPLVAIPGESQDGGGGGIYMVDVRVGRASLLERIYPGIHEGASLLPERTLNPSGVSDRQRRRSSLNAMSRSQLVAITVALRELGRDVSVTPAGAEVVLVVPDAPADGVVEVGDVIVAANGEEIGTVDDLQAAFAGVEPGEEVELTVDRDGKPSDLVVGTRAAGDDADRAVMGVQVENAEDFDFPVDIEIDAGGIGGPSAGLAFALDIVDELGDEDLSRGRTIVATGELDLEGNVLPIGGVTQKAIGARDAGADVFLVPDGNYEEARDAVDGLRVVPVSTFAEALDVLRES
ncbi:MAG TPA: S16 family serine protease [Gaiellaceae bacterium]|nr:S16 family serine protease [Gaiellaceae bacterium]